MKTAHAATCSHMQSHAFKLQSNIEGILKLDRNAERRRRNYGRNDENKRRGSKEKWVEKNCSLVLGSERKCKDGG